MSLQALRPAEPLVRRPTRRVCVESRARRIQDEWDRGLRTSWSSDSPVIDWLAWHGRTILRVVALAVILGGAGSFLTCALLSEVPIIDTSRAFGSRR